jgi:single-stranded-DNA-specific exonuclease
MPPQWNFLPADPVAVQDLHEVLHLPVPLCRVLVQRGLSNLMTARRFFRFVMADLHDPFLMQDMDKAVTRLQRAVENGERILLYGDYDVDGATSVALLHCFLEGFYGNIDYYLPNREREGYGVSLEGIEYARETETGLIVAMDCGIRAFAALERAKEYGIDVIVCDHHLPEQTLPHATAILDPKRLDCPYPYKELSGCGITFKLIQGYATQQGLPVEELYPLLDYVAISTACDIVPMTGENRLLTKFGLQRINRNPRTGIWALLQNSNRDLPLDVTDVVFGLGPLLNAPGRIGDAREAVRLLISTDPHQAADFAARLLFHNRERKERHEAAADAAQQRIESAGGIGSRNCLVVYDPDWHKGIIGIVASRLVDQYHRPAIVLTESQGRAVGSARSVSGFDLYAALQACESFLITFGGHAHAAGLQLAVENIPAFRLAFEQEAAQRMQQVPLSPTLDICSELLFSEIDEDFMKKLASMEPFGPENRTPVFWAKNVVDTGKSRILDNNHAKLSLCQLENPHVTAQGIAFGLGDTFSDLRDQVMDVAFTLKEDTWQGKKRIDLHVKAIRLAD